MNIQETITQEYIQFDYEKNGYYFVVRVDFNDNVECKKSGDDGAIDIQVYDDYYKWIKRRDVVLGKILKAKKLCNKIEEMDYLLDKAIKGFKADLDPENSLDGDLICSVDKIKIDYSDLEREARQIPFGVLERFEKK